MSTGIHPAAPVGRTPPLRSAVPAFVVTLLALLVLDMVAGTGRDPAEPAPAPARMQAQLAPALPAVRSAGDDGDMARGERVP